jgi:hypothetical protein
MNQNITTRCKLQALRHMLLLHRVSPGWSRKYITSFKSPHSTFAPHAAAVAAAAAQDLIM